MNNILEATRVIISVLAKSIGYALAFVFFMLGLILLGYMGLTFVLAANHIREVIT